jgi:hypothetical protein
MTFAGVYGLDFLIAAILGIVGAIKDDPKDRVLRWEAIALGSFLAGGALTFYLVRLRVNALMILVLFVLFFPGVLFTVLAGCFALQNWLRRRRQGA